MINIKDNGENNNVNIGKNISIEGIFNGNGNIVCIGDADHASSFKISVNGNCNKITIGNGSRCLKLLIHIGNHVHAHSVSVDIADMFTCETDCKFLLYNSGNKLSIGKDCMFSNSIILRCGESPHLIFENSTGRYLDVTEGVKIGSHVWVGEKSYITKRSMIADDSIVAACSVVTRKFFTPNVVLGGNPARVIKEDVKWIRNWGKLEAGSIYHESYHNYIKNIGE